MSGIFDRSGSNKGGNGLYQQNGINTGGSSEVFPEKKYTSSGSSGTGAGAAPAILDINGLPELASGITAQEVVNLLELSEGGLTAQEFIDLVNNSVGDVSASLSNNEIVLSFNGLIQDNELASAFVKTVDGNLPNASGNVISTVVIQNKDGSQASSGIQTIRFEGNGVSDPAIQGSTATFTITDTSGGGGATQIGLAPFGSTDHSGDENNAEIVLGDAEGNVLSQLPIEVTELGNIPSTNALIDNTNDRLIFQISTDVQSGDNRPVSSGAVDTAIQTKADLSYVNSQLAAKADQDTTVLDADVGLNGSDEVTSITIGADVRQIAQPDISGKADIATTVIDSDLQVDGANQITGISIGSVVRAIAGTGISTVTGTNSTSVANLSALTFASLGDTTTTVNIIDNGDGTATAQFEVSSDITGSLNVRDSRSGSEVMRALNAIRIMNDHDVELQFTDGSTPYTIRTVDDLMEVGGILYAVADNAQQGSGFNISEWADNNIDQAAIVVADNGTLSLHGTTSEDINALLGGGGGFSYSGEPFPSGFTETATFSRTVEVDGEEQTFFIVGTRVGTSPYSVNGSLSVGNSSVFSTLPGMIVLTVTASSGAFTSIDGSTPAGGTISANTVSWPSADYNAAGNHSFSAETTGTDSDDEEGNATASASFTRYVPEYVMNSQPATFADFTGERAPSTSLTGTNPMGSTFLVTTVDYGAVKTVQVMGFNLDAPRVATGIVSGADISGATHSYSVYRFAIDQGTGVTL